MDKVPQELSTFSSPEGLKTEYIIALNKQDNEKTSDSALALEKRMGTYAKDEVSVAADIVRHKITCIKKMKKLQ
jgi:hypothetical protein